MYLVRALLRVLLGASRSIRNLTFIFELSPPPHFIYELIYELLLRSQIFDIDLQVFDISPL